jgi:uncharacterized protein (DUF1330 family)
MPVYMLFIREGAIRDQSEMDQYSRMNRQSPPDPKLKPLVVYGAIESVEGAAPDGMVMLQFPTVEDAKAWYNSPGYQAAIPHRMKGADYRAFIVQGLG